MMTKTLRGLLAFTTILMTAACAFGAHNVEIDFITAMTKPGNSETVVKDGVSFTFTGLENYGAQVAYDHWQNYKFVVSASQSIAHIEFIGEVRTDKTDDVEHSPGTLTRHADGIYIWEGPANSLSIIGNSNNTNLRISRARVWFVGSEYEHTNWAGEGGSQGVGSGGARLYPADVHLENDKTDYSKKDRIYSPVDVLPRHGRGVPMAVVSDRKFASVLGEYLDWKTQQGYEISEIYTDDSAFKGLSGEDLAHAIRSRLIAMDPRPAYVLLVGDDDEIPPFWDQGRRYQHATDFYYGEFTDDYFADAYVGRFSAKTVDDLQPQLDKTRHMAKLTPENGAWLNQSLTIDSVAANIITMREGAKFSADYPLNFDDAVVYQTDAGYVQKINGYFKDGCSFVNYFGHGMDSSWNMEYSVTNARQLENVGKYPVVVSIACYTGRYSAYADCLAEVFIRQKDAGAVAVIACTHESWPDTNNKFFLGYNGTSVMPRLGFFRSLFPAVGDDLSQRSRTIGQAMNVGTYAMVRYSEGYYVQDQSLFTLFGDPTYQPYITAPKANSIASETSFPAGRELTVTTAPDAMVCLSRVSPNREIVVVGMSDKDGIAKLYVPAGSPQGAYTLYSSAPYYNDVSIDVTIAGTTGNDDVTIETLPVLTASDVISRQSVGEAVTDNWPSSQMAFGFEKSGSGYAIWAASEKQQEERSLSHRFNTTSESESIFMRNNYPSCGLITTKSGGKARYVSVEWLHPTGKCDVLGVYGRHNAYRETSEAWSNPGEKIGELTNSGTSQLVIDKDYEYLLFRAENYKEETGEQSNVFIKTLTIGWDDGTRKTYEVVPGGVVEVAANTAADAEKLGSIKVADTAAKNAGQAEVLKLVATASGSGKWTLKAVIDPTRMPEGQKLENTLSAFGAALQQLTLQAKARTTTTVDLEIPAEYVTRGLYYSATYASTLDFAGAQETPRVLATGGAITLKLPADGAKTRFFKVKASMTAQGE